MTRAADPLFDTLFRPTASSDAIASAAPVRAPGTRTRAGNAMNRTRAALMDGAVRAVSTSGTRITMAQVAAAAGVAKATLYNHFRTREAVLTALVSAEVARVIEECAPLPLEDALRRAAAAVANHPALRALSRLDPGVLATVACVDDTSEGWRAARAAVSEALAGAGLIGPDTVVRWLSSFVLTPAGPAAIAADVEVLVAGLPTASGPVEAAPAEPAVVAG